MAGGSKASRKGGGKGGGSSRSRDPRRYGQGHTSEGSTAKKKSSTSSSSRVGGGGGGLKGFSSSANRLYGGSFDLTASDDDDVSFLGGASAGGTLNKSSGIMYHVPVDDGMSSLAHAAQLSLKQAMVGRLTRNSNAKDLSFDPKELLKTLEELVQHRDTLLAYALLAEDESTTDDDGETLPVLLSEALPENLSKKMKGKAKMADILVETYFVYVRIVRSGIDLPRDRSPFSKALQNFGAIMVRVHNFCAHELEVEQTRKKALKSEPITGKKPNVY